LLRLGAQLVLGDEEMPVPAAASAGGASTKVRAGTLRPMDHELAWEVVVPNPMVRRLVQRPELAEALQGDIARALARRAEEAFLRGNPAAGPRGIRHDPGVLKHVPGGPPHDPVDLLRGMVTKLRRAPRARFHDPGWILSPGALDRLTRHVAAGRSLDDTRLLQHDGQDGGVLLGYPFVATGAAHDDAVAVDTIYFGSDWSEAWIGAGRGVVGIDVSSDAHFARGQTGVRAVVQHDFLLREPACFVVMDLPR
jgi:HK97 family phage major capsid protein